MKSKIIVFVHIYCDYSKHDNYDQWIEDFGLEYNYDSILDKVNAGYFTSLNTACSELIKNKFPNGSFYNDPGKEKLIFGYTSLENFGKDYKSIKKITKLKYVETIKIFGIDQTIGGDLGE